MIERRNIYAIFDHQTGELTATARPGHARAMSRQGHEVYRVQFERWLADVGEPVVATDVVAVTEDDE
jgi:hypothetical protein